MTCPKCGLQPLADQKFCRSCGASLQMTTQPLADPAAVSDQKRTSAIGLKGEAQRLNSFVLWGLIMMLLGAGIGVVGKKLVHEDIITVVGVLISFVGMFLAVYPYLVPSPHEKREAGFSSEPEVLTPSHPTEYLPQGSNIEYVPSITERTTDLLKNSAATRSGQKEGGESRPDKAERRAKPLD